MIEKSLDAKILKQEIKQNKFIILCVESSIFNNDINMDGGHFVILSEVNVGDFLKVINPIKNEYETKYLSLNFLIKYCRNYGSRRILVNEEK